MAINSRLLYSPIIWGWQVYLLFSDEQHVKFIEGQVTEADASGSDLAPSTAPNPYNPNQVFQIGNGFGFFLIFLSQRYNPLDFASKVSAQGAEVPWDSCEILMQQNNRILHTGIFFH